MNKKNMLKAAIRTSIFGVFIYASVSIAAYFGVDEKSFFLKYWDIIAGGGIGWVVGIGTFIVVGTVGWVAGPLYGAVGLFAMATGGLLGGLGLGGVVNMIRNHKDFDFNRPIIILVLAIGFIGGWFLSKFLTAKLYVAVERRRRKANKSSVGNLKNIS